MKRYLVVVMAFAVIGVICFLAGNSLADETAWGIVKSVSPDQIILAEYDYASGQENEVVYIVSPNSNATNNEVLKNINVGEEIQLSYVNARMATGFTVNQPVYEQMPPEEMYYQQPGQQEQALPDEAGAAQPDYEE